MLKVKSRKNLTEVTKRHKNAWKLYNLIANACKSDDDTTKLQIELENTGIDLFFNHLHQYLTTDMFFILRKHTVPQEGLFILLDGRAALVWLKHKHDRNRKQHLFNLARSGIFSTLTTNPYYPFNENFADGFSLAVNEPFSILENSYGNVLMLEDTVVLKIPENVIEESKFYYLANYRQDLCESAKLPISSITGKLISINTALHHLFRKRKFHFHDKFSINNYGVIDQGNVIFKAKNGQKFEGFKSTLLFPNIQYDVYSAQLTIIEFTENQTFVIEHPEDALKFYSAINIRQVGQKIISNSLATQNVTEISEKTDGMYEKAINELKKLNESEVRKRKKNIANVSKEFQNFFIVPTEMCRTSLKFAQTRNAENSNWRQTVRNRIGFIKEHKQSRSQTQNLPKISKHKDLSILDRYCNVSQDLYKKFIHRKQAQHKENIRIK